MKTEKNRGSLTVEATLILPIWLSICMFFLYFFQIMLIQEKVNLGLWETAKEISQYSYIVREDGTEDPGKKESTEQTSTATAKHYVSGLLTGQRMKRYLSDAELQASCVNGGIGGIIYVTQALQKEDEICLAASYSVEFPVFSFLVPEMHFVQQIKSRGFVGTTKIGEGDDEEEDEMVFISKSSTTSKVYHKVITCTHINLNISTTTFGEVAGLRNQNHGKYYPCEKCAKNKSFKEQDTIYVAKDGNRYHSTLGCSGLTRNVEEVKLSTLKGYRPCKRCGGGQ